MGLSETGKICSIYVQGRLHIMNIQRSCSLLEHFPVTPKIPRNKAKLIKRTGSLVLPLGLSLLNHVLFGRKVETAGDNNAEFN